MVLKQYIKLCFVNYHKLNEKKRERERERPINSFKSKPSRFVQEKNLKKIYLNLRMSLLNYTFNNQIMTKKNMCRHHVLNYFSPIEVSSPQIPTHEFACLMS